MQGREASHSPRGSRREGDFLIPESPISAMFRPFFRDSRTRFAEHEDYANGLKSCGVRNER